MNSKNVNAVKQLMNELNVSLDDLLTFEEAISSNEELTEEIKASNSEKFPDENYFKERGITPSKRIKRQWSKNTPSYDEDNWKGAHVCDF